MPDDADSAMRQTGRVAVLLAVQLPCRPLIVAVGVYLMPVRKPQVQAAILIPTRVGTRQASPIDQRRMDDFIDRFAA